MPDIVSVEYQQTGNSTSTNPYGMREMQERAFEYRDAQYMLLKSPPASGKSRALMFLALDKMNYVNMHIKQILLWAVMIVAATTFLREGFINF